jgi:hypothetical protein
VHVFIGEEQGENQLFHFDFERLYDESKFKFNISALVMNAIKAVSSVNGYLTQQDKEVLHSRIEQKRSNIVNKNGYKHHNKPTKYIHASYRYVVEIPENYTPRKMENVNYVTPDWIVPGHKTTRWASIYNAEKLAKRNNGKVLWHTETNKKVKIEYLLPEQHHYRRIADVAPSDTPTKRIYKV